MMMMLDIYLYVSYNEPLALVVVSIDSVLLLSYHVQNTYISASYSFYVI